MAKNLTNAIVAENGHSFVEIDGDKSTLVYQVKRAQELLDKIAKTIGV